MVLKKSALTPELKRELENQRAEGDISFAAELDIQRRAEEMRRKLDAKREELLKVKATRQAYGILAKTEPGEYREVAILSRRPEVGAKMRVHFGTTEMSDRMDLLRRVSRTLGIRAGSLPLEEAQEWAGRAAQYTDSPMGIRRSVIVDVQTGVMAPTVKAFVKQAEPETITRAEYKAWLWSENKALVKRAITARAKGLVKA
jgi:hypothetical protein